MSAGVSSAVPPGEPLIGMIIDAVQTQLEASSLGAADAERLVSAVLDVLLAPPIADELVRCIAVMQSRADDDDAFRERDDLYDSYDGPEPRARLALMALRQALGRGVQDEDAELQPEVAAAMLGKVTYKPGWKFAVCRMPGRALGVRAQGRFDDSRGNGKNVAASRRAWDRGSLLRNALAAVEALEIHEAREQFRYDGVAIFNEHRERAEDPVPPQKEELGPPPF